MEQYENYKGFELSYYPNKMFKSGGDTIIDRSGWGVKGIFLQGKETGLQLAKEYIDKLYEQFGDETMKIPVWKLKDNDEH